MSDKLLLDANVLVHYRLSMGILRKVATSIGRVYILSEILKEANKVMSRKGLAELTEQLCEENNLVLFEPSADKAEALLESATNCKHRGLSFEDKPLLCCASMENFLCVTSDNLLGKACDAESVEHWRGLRLMIFLVRKKQLSPEEAYATAEGMHKYDPHYLHKGVLDEFRKEIYSVLP